MLVSGAKGGKQAKPLLLAGLVGGLYDFIVATFGWWNENFTTRVFGWGEMLADKAKLVFKVNTGAALLGLGYIVGPGMPSSSASARWQCGGSSCPPWR